MLYRDGSSRDSLLYKDWLHRDVVDEALHCSQFPCSVVLDTDCSTYQCQPMRYVGYIDLVTPWPGHVQPAVHVVLHRDGS